jgi:hypothetical protein
MCEGLVRSRNGEVEEDWVGLDDLGGAIEDYEAWQIACQLS